MVWSWLTIKYFWYPNSISPSNSGNINDKLVAGFNTLGSTLILSRAHPGFYLLENTFRPFWNLIIECWYYLYYQRCWILCMSLIHPEMGYSLLPQLTIGNTVRRSWLFYAKTLLICLNSVYMICLAYTRFIVQKLDEDGVSRYSGLSPPSHRQHKAHKGYLFAVSHAEWRMKR